MAVKFEGPKGKLELNVHPTIKVALDAAKKELVVTRPTMSAEQGAARPDALAAGQLR
jgi:ribosomal protein L6P/L9E